MDKSQDLARDRTDWAEDRTILANERTFAGWMRTGMATVALALGLRVVFGEIEPGWLPRGVALLLVGVAICIFWLARNKARETINRLNDHATEPLPTLSITVIAGALSLAAAATGAFLWWL